MYPIGGVTHYYKLIVIIVNSDSVNYYSVVSAAVWPRIHGSSDLPADKQQRVILC